NITNPQPATRCLSRSRSLQRTRSASPGNTSQEATTDGPASRDRTYGSAPRKTRRTLPDPTPRSTADRKDGQEPPPTPGGTKAPLAAAAAYGFPSPWLHSKLEHLRCKVIKTYSFSAPNISPIICQTKKCGMHYTSGLHGEDLAQVGDSRDSAWIARLDLQSVDPPPLRAPVS